MILDERQPVKMSRGAIGILLFVALTVIAHVGFTTLAARRLLSIVENYAVGTPVQICDQSGLNCAACLCVPAPPPVEGAP